MKVRIRSIHTSECDWVARRQYDFPTNFIAGKLRIVYINTWLGKRILAVYLSGDFQYILPGWEYGFMAATCGPTRRRICYSYIKLTK